MRKPSRTFVDPRPKHRQDKDHEQTARQDKEMREQQTEEEIDKTLKDSFPASDPPGNY